ncbi:hypothetical protein HBH56_133490 [Parastagonospora nodorum]|uniref:Uncharacterized protein n=1 Tax=Phaeosphaeria nodorum (strain SN15 / ATCC MYA-4574 / FGSC 10173) TaxID=321614 RepID=A0A7U2FCJ5_PHANO|nr:hypothetical protein HBH56_133490 [Parastagonospora nodorum]QRD02742.1 hypothetical protein JI435_114760 [Parastagonospora nodorum SN15]KAH3926999.1 hypothetical protein HBH54_159800 [Parastagonospora nodorum]KAH3949255.1 hypothetical protein HBH53_088570 [Parastagonospora nodorum]KAH4119961.1 hypothetical protein HBH47_117620 [Parastagonospora nodorum]
MEDEHGAAAESHAGSRDALGDDLTPNATGRRMREDIKETAAPQFDSHRLEVRSRRLHVKTPTGSFTPLPVYEDDIEPGDGMSVLSPQSHNTKSMAIHPSKVVDTPSTDTAPTYTNIAPAKIAQSSSTIETLEPRKGLATSTTTRNLGTESIGVGDLGDRSQAEVFSRRVVVPQGSTNQGERQPRVSANEPEASHTQSPCDSCKAPVNLTASAPQPVQPQLTMSTASSASSDEAMEMASDNSSSSVESPATGSSSTKRTPVSPEGVLLHPISIQNLPAPKTDEALFLPADAERTWYTGFVKPWNNFHKEAYTYWRSAHLRDALDEVRNYRFTPPVAGTIDAGSVAGPNILHTQFSRETLQGIQKVYTLLMSTQTMRQNKQPNKIWLGDPEDEDLNNAESVWKPSYVVKASRNADDETTRILGQVEYLGGRLGALTWAISQQYMNSWGSLRCVLGK